MTDFLAPSASGGNGLTALFCILLLVTNFIVWWLNENSWPAQFVALPRLLCISNRRKFSDRYPGSYWAWTTLDPRHLAASYWCGQTGVFLVRVGALLYVTGTLVVDGTTGLGFQGAQWMVFFSNWSLCLIAVSAMLGMLVSLKHIAITYQEERMVIHGRPGQKMGRDSSSLHEPRQGRHIRRSSSGLGAAAAACFTPSVGATTGDDEEDAALEEAAAQARKERAIAASAYGHRASGAAEMVNGDSSHAAGAGPSTAGAADFTPLHKQGTKPAPQGVQGLQTPAEPMVPATTLAPGVEPEEAERSLISDTRPSQQGHSGAKQKLAGRSIVADVPPSTDSRAVAAAYRTASMALQPGPMPPGTSMQTVPEDLHVSRFEGDSRMMLDAAEASEASKVREHLHQVHSQPVVQPVKGRGHIRTPSDIEAMRPAELRYAPTLTNWAFLEKLHCLAVQTAAASAALVTVYYWPFIYKVGGTQPQAADYLKHAVNLGIMFFDVWCSRAPFVSYHFQVCIWYGSVYLFFVWIYFAGGQRWIYPALNWHQDRSIGFYMLLPVVYAGVFLIWMGIATIRDLLGARFGSHRWLPGQVEPVRRQAAPSTAQQPHAPQQGMDGQGGDLNWRFNKVGASQQNAPVVANSSAAARERSAQDDGRPPVGSPSTQGDSSMRHISSKYL